MVYRIEDAGSQQYEITDIVLNKKGDRGESIVVTFPANAPEEAMRLAVQGLLNKTYRRSVRSFVMTKKVGDHD